MYYVWNRNIEEPVSDNFNTIEEAENYICKFIGLTKNELKEYLQDTRYCRYEIRNTEDEQQN